MRRRAVRTALAFALTLFASAGFAAETTPAPASLDVRRMAEVGRLWGMVRYLHPYLAYKNIDWDAALVAALPRIRVAETEEEYAAAVQSLLDALGDPVTRVREAEPRMEPEGGGEAPTLYRRLDDGVLVVDLARVLRTAGFMAVLRDREALVGEIGRASAVVLDLRGDGGQGAFVLDSFARALVGRPCRGPAQRFLLHSGYRPQNGTTSGGYYSGFLTRFADQFEPVAGAGAPGRVVFLVDRDTAVPSVALALQVSGDGRIVAEGGLSEDSAVELRRFPLGKDRMVQVRVSELLPLPGWPGLRADVEVPKGSGDAALAAALREARSRTSAKPAAPAVSPAAPSLPDPVFRADRSYSDLVEPSLEYRQLAVIRAWNVIQFFYPYRNLIGDWDAVLPEFLGRMEEAKTGRDYALTLAEMMAHVADGHTRVYGHPELSKFFGRGFLPVEVRWVEESPVITRAGETALQAGVRIGDEVLAVDGEPAAERMQRLEPYLTASTRPALLNRLFGSLLRGEPGSTARLTLRGAGGKVREVRMERDPGAEWPEPAGETVRILPGNLGYVDLTRLSQAEVDAMFERVKDTRALIFDMRGYPQGTAWSIAPRINTTGARFGATFRRSQVAAFSDEEGESGFFFSQPLPVARPDQSRYTRPVVMLIDDRAISQAEHSGLFFEAANGTRFIGSPTAGANGDVTNFSLPGGVMVSFTGHDVRHADGRQLQRVGLIPDVPVAPTRAGIRAGRDEVLERAIQVLEKDLGAKTANAASP